MKITYPITANYVHTWDPKRAITELVSNMFDGATERGTPYRVSYDRRKRTLALTNVDVTLSRDALLLGESSKRDSDSSIGQFGEGLKLGCLVLRRERFPVVIKNGRHETWKPEIEHVEGFGKPVLVMNIVKASRQVGDLVVEVEGVEPELWEAVERLFLPLKKVDGVKATPAGDLIDNPEEVGNLYVRGVFVGHQDNYSYGFNFKDVRVGRDRELPDQYDIDTGIRDIFRYVFDEASSTDDDTLYDLINSHKPEGHAFKYQTYSPLARRMASVFKSRNGEEAVPVLTTEAATELSHYGVTPVVVHDNLHYLITTSGHVASATKVKAGRGNDVVKTYALDELEARERVNYADVTEVLSRAKIDTAGRLSVVDFRDGKVLGLHHGQRIDVARRIVGDFGEFMVTALHELAHDAGADGTAEHRAAYERLSAAVFRALR